MYIPNNGLVYDRNIFDEIHQQISLLVIQMFVRHFGTFHDRAA